MTDPSVVLEGVGHWYRPGQWVFRDIDIAVRPGEVFAILGSNGCGKTTLLKAMLGLQPARAGKIALAGPAGFVPQLFTPNVHYTAFDMALMGRAANVRIYRTPSQRDEAIVRECFETLGLGALADRPFDELSGGQRQMVIVARALASEAQILVLDEPTSALDLANQAAVLTLIRRLACERGFTVIFTTHQPQHAFAAADKALLMVAPDERICGDIDAVMTEANLHRVYGAEVGRVSFLHKGLTVEAVVPVLNFRR